MARKRWFIVGVAALAASAGAVYQVSAQQGQPSSAPATSSGNSQPATSSGNAQPGTGNSPGQPRPANATPRPVNAPAGAQPVVQPNRPTTTNPDGTPRVNGQTPQPGMVNNPNGVNPNVVNPIGVNGNGLNGPGVTVNGVPVNGQPATGVNGVGVNGNVTATGLGRYERPFAFTSPAVEARFTENSRRLMALENRMTTSNQSLLKRLGEARNLSPDRQNAALADVLQQFLLDQQAMQKYLVQARTAWSGEMEPLPAELSEEVTPMANPVDANTAPSGTPAVPPNPGTGTAPGGAPAAVPVTPPTTNPQVQPQNSPR